MSTRELAKKAKEKILELERLQPIAVMSVAIIEGFIAEFKRETENLYGVELFLVSSGGGGELPRFKWFINGEPLTDKCECFPKTGPLNEAMDFINFMAEEKLPVVDLLEELFTD